MLPFVAASFLLILIPGPDQALITRNALVGGRRAGWATMFGGASGISVHATAAAFGLSALIATSAAAFSVLKLIGVTYLLLLGVQTLRSAGQAQDNGVPATAPSRGLRRYVRQGALSNALNPKVAVFFLTFLPQFLPGGAGPATALAFAGLFAATYLLWFTTYVLLVDTYGRWLRRPRVRAAIERTTGTLLIAFGVRLALERR